MKRGSWAAILFAAAIAVFFRSALNVAAEPPIQNPTPTDEPTKQPYVFPTPIFIPTYASATDLPPRSATPAGGITYIVQAGDNPSVIAKKVYGDSGKFQLIVDANNLTVTNRLRVGQTLIIPPLTPIAPTQPPSAPLTPAAATPTATPAIASPTPPTTLAADFSPTPEPAAAVEDSPNPTEQALTAMACVLFLGFIGITLLTLSVYRRSRQQERVEFIKQRLKGK